MDLKVGLRPDYRMIWGVWKNHTRAESLWVWLVESWEPIQGDWTGVGTD